MATVFIDFTEPGASKQDCETKAFYRLEKVLKKRLGRANVCLLMGGLYATQQVFEICDRNNWSFMISLKEGSLPLLWKEAQRQLALNPKIDANDKSRKSVIYRKIDALIINE